MRLPRTLYQPSVWKARHMQGYARAIERLGDALTQKLPETDVYLRLEVVYNASGRPFGRGLAGFRVWTRFTAWETTS